MKPPLKGKASYRNRPRAGGASDMGKVMQLTNGKEFYNIDLIVEDGVLLGYTAEFVSEKFNYMLCVKLYQYTKPGKTYNWCNGQVDVIVQNLNFGKIQHWVRIDRTELRDTTLGLTNFLRIPAYKFGGVTTTTRDYILGDKKYKQPKYYDALIGDR